MTAPNPPVDSPRPAGTVKVMTSSDLNSREPRASGPADASPATARPQRATTSNRPGGRRAGAASRRPRTGLRRPAAVLALVVVTAGVAGAAVAFTTGSKPAGPPPATGPSLLAPADGRLQVGSVSLEQMVGSCDATSCYHVPPRKPVTVKVTSGQSLKLSAGQSTLFTVGAFNMKKRSQPAPLLVREGMLHLEGVAAGTYQVTIAGQPKGGMWQFILKVSAKDAAKDAAKEK